MFIAAKVLPSGGSNIVGGAMHDDGAGAGGKGAGGAGIGGKGAGLAGIGAGGVGVGARVLVGSINGNEGISATAGPIDGSVDVGVCVRGGVTREQKVLSPRRKLGWVV